MLRDIEVIVNLRRNRALNLTPAFRMPLIPSSKPVYKCATHGVMLRPWSLETFRECH